MSTFTTNGAGAENDGEKVNTHIVTLTRFLTEEQVKHKEATGDFTYVITYTNPFPVDRANNRIKEKTQLT